MESTIIITISSMDIIIQTMTRINQVPATMVLITTCKITSIHEIITTTTVTIITPVVTTITEVHITTRVTVKTRTLTIKQITRNTKNNNSQNNAYARKFLHTQSLNDDKICWFHEKFLSRAKKCIDGCKYIENKRLINTVQEN